ncbi:MAG: recN [Chlamydiales bacterium]|jgi:DNA repair protein RecN (Recombination protein N)|nr:recN [Chlamydiales bacterium]
MLKELCINNVALVESLRIAFEPGLNVLTGETGAGKSAIMESLAVVLGKRASASLIRHETTRATIEASFDIERLEEVKNLLEKAGIDHQPDELLIIRREITTGEKNRCFINNQAAQISLLQELGQQLVNISGQHAYQRLFSLEQQRLFVDLYGELQPLVTEVKEAWELCQSKNRQLSQLMQSTAQQQRDIDMFQRQLEEIDEFRLKPGEENDLFEEYTKLVHSEDLSSKIESICGKLTEGNFPILTSLSRCKNDLMQLKSYDSSLEDTAEAFQRAFIELQEASYTLRSYLNGLEIDPNRLSKVDERLKVIAKLKKKYGDSVEAILEYRELTAKKLQSLSSMDEQIDTLNNEIALLEQRFMEFCNQLTAKRKSAAKKLAASISEHLKVLNMPRAEFSIECKMVDRQSTGQDQIDFYLAPNRGERSIPLRECASGGELSRVMLALQTVLSGKEKYPTIVFDEIDANIGGETAVTIGKKLAHIAEQHQVLCITHLPQVACQANHHLCIKKIERKGRTYSEVKVLDKQGRTLELARLMGGETFSTATTELAEKLLKTY